MYLKTHPNKVRQIFSVYSLKSFITLCFTVRNWFWVDFYEVWHLCLGSLFLHMDIDFSQQHLLRGLFSQLNYLCPFVKIIWMGLLFGSIFILLIYIFFHQSMPCNTYNKHKILWCESSNYLLPFQDCLAILGPLLSMST